MNRRQFTARLAALFAAPAFPAKALLPAPAIAATAPIAPPNLYTWSAAIARTHGKCSADMLKNMLHVDAEKATALFNRLVANNVVGPADAFGLSQARSVIPTPTGFPEKASNLVPSSSEDRFDLTRFDTAHDDPDETPEDDNLNAEDLTPPMEDPLDDADEATPWLHPCGS